MRYVRFLGVALVSAGGLALSACASSGVIQGRISGQPIQLHYHQNAWPSGGTISTVTPNGEHFSGKFVIGSNSSTGVGINPVTGSPSVFTAGGNTSQASATLMGNKGDSMYCVFRLAAPDAGFTGGGVGHCKLSTGQMINVSF